jgi:prepilin-type N-terminal cleavage/methylation domain-containing protein
VVEFVRLEQDACGTESLPKSSMIRSFSKPAAVPQSAQPSQAVPPVSSSRVVAAMRRGISLVEMMIVIAIIAILSVLVLAAVSDFRRTANSTACLLHLHTIQAAFLQYANDNNGHYPSRVTNHSWESLLSPYIGPTGAFQCPADSEIFPHDGSSYDWRDVPDPEATLAGKHVGGAIRGNAVLAYESLPGWHAQSKINAVLINGRCEPMDVDACLSDLTKSVAISKPRGP